MKRDSTSRRKLSLCATRTVCAGVAGIEPSDCLSRLFDYEAGLHVKKKALPLRHENRVRWSGWHRTLGLPESTIRDHPHRGVARVDAGAGRTSFTRGQRSVERSRSQTSAITAPGQPRDQTIMWTFEAGPLGNAPKKCSRYSVAAAITRLRFSSKYGSYTEPSRHIA